jgi:hypothetical protein
LCEAPNTAQDNPNEEQQLFHNFDFRLRCQIKLWVYLKDFQQSLRLVNAKLAKMTRHYSTQPKSMGDFCSDLIRATEF